MSETNALQPLAMFLEGTGPTRATDCIIVISSMTLLFEPPRANSRVTKMNEWVPKVAGMFLGMVGIMVAGTMATTSLGLIC